MRLGQLHDDVVLLMLADVFISALMGFTGWAGSTVRMVLLCALLLKGNYWRSYYACLSADKDIV